MTVDMTGERSRTELLAEVEDLRSRLAEADDVLRAIRNGEVDAVMVDGALGEQVYTLTGAETVYRHLIEAMSEGALILSRDGCILYANRTMAQLLQTPLEQVIGADFQFFVAPQDQSLLADLVEQAWDGTSRGVLSIRAAEGQSVPVRLGLSRLQLDPETLVCMVVTDLTEVQKKEDALNQLTLELERRVEERTADLSASRLAALNMMEDAVAAREAAEKAHSDLVRLGAAVAQTADSVVITDKEGSIQYVNPAFERVTGYAKEDVLNQNPRLLKSGKTAPAVYQDLWETVTRGEVWTGQLINRKKDGTLFEERVTISPIYGESGEIINYVAVKQDISDLRQLEDQLRQSQKLEAIGMLAGGIAHDFNNLLTVISGYSDLTLMRLSKEDPLHRNISEVIKAAERAAGLTRQLLAFSRKQVLQPRVLDLNAIVSELEKMLRRLIGEDIGLRTVLGPGLGSVKADPGQIEQIIMNLAVNARDAMPRGGKLTIETANVYLDEYYAKVHIAVVPGPYVMFAVSDTGAGMDQPTQARIFEPFFTTKEVGKGTGLGLSTVYGIVKQSGGNIWVYSEIGQGTTFKVYLPRVDENTQESAPAIATESVVKGSETVLLAEDEDSVRTLARQILEMHGYQVLEAANGGAALLICERHKEEIHLLITDVVMPEMSGRELADRLAQLRTEMKVLYMSGYTDNAIVHRGVLEEGANFIQKPFPTEALARKVREVLDTPKKSL